MLPYESTIPDAEPISPIDPHMSFPLPPTGLPVRPSLATHSETRPRSPSLIRREARETGHTDFFSAVYLDSPLGPDEIEQDSLDGHGGAGGQLEIVGCTRPLRVKKKALIVKMPRHAGSCEFPCASCRENTGLTLTVRRRSTVSVPTSPESLRSFSIPPSPLLARSDTITSTSSSTLRAHHSISRIFLNASPIAATPLPMPSPIRASTSLDRLSAPIPPPRSPARPPRVRRIASATSEYHLNLGVSSSFDSTALPGPSPPNTGGSSPHRREFLAVTKSPLPAQPASPVTPSRAPAKAAKLLGAGIDKPAKTAAAILTRPYHKKRQNFRPLPTQTLVEIERFFGEVPRKSKALPRPPYGSKTVNATWPGPAGGERHVGEGKTIRHMGADGNMWLDVEEEQEFTWLMSDVSFSVPSPLPVVVDAQGWEVIYEETSDNGVENEQWGLENFKSVLAMSEPQSMKSRHPFAAVGASIKEKTLAKKGKKVMRDKEESFMDFGESKSSKNATLVNRPKRLVVPTSTLPWSSSTESLTVVTPTKSESFSSPDASPSHSSRSRSASPPVRPPRPDSPPRVRNRPPPLTLQAGKKNPNLPIVSTTPEPTRVEARIDATPVTPFVRPRRAPVPHEAPAVPAFALIPAIPILPPMPAMDAQRRDYLLDIDNNLSFSPTLPRRRTHTSKAARLMGLDPLEDPTMQDVSFFEPESPTNPKYGLSSKGAKVGGLKVSGAWFKKVVKPLSGKV